MGSGWVLEGRWDLSGRCLDWVQEDDCVLAEVQRVTLLHGKKTSLHSYKPERSLYAQRRQAKNHRLSSLVLAREISRAEKLFLFMVFPTCSVRFIKPVLFKSSSWNVRSLSTNLMWSLQLLLQSQNTFYVWVKELMKIHCVQALCDYVLLHVWGKIHVPEHTLLYCVAFFSFSHWLSFVIRPWTYQTCQNKGYLPRPP